APGAGKSVIVSVSRFTTTELMKRCPDRIIIVDQPDAAQYHVTLGFSLGVNVFHHQWAATLFDATASESVAQFRTGSRARIARGVCKYFEAKTSTTNTKKQ